MPHSVLGLPRQRPARASSSGDVRLVQGMQPTDRKPDAASGCGGNCACTTCHVIVRQGFNKLSEASEQEEDLLDRAPGLTPTSRLGCQAVIEDPDAEIVVTVPRFTINQISEGR